MTAGIIHTCGAFGGHMAGPTKHNQRGMFENRNIVDRLVKPFLRDIGADPMGQRPLPDIGLCKDVADTMELKFRLQLQATMVDHGYRSGPWMYKGPKMCLIWPIWHAAFPEAHWIIVRRDAQDIAESCVRTSFMRAYSGLPGWLGWVAEHEQRFEEMIAAGLNIRQVWTQRIIDGDFAEVRDVVAWLGLPWYEEEVRAFVDPKLWKGGH